MAWLPFIVLFFGIGQAPAIVIIFIAAFFPVLLSTVSAIQNIDPVYIKVARNFGIKQPELLFKIVLPAVFPGIASGLDHRFRWAFTRLGRIPYRKMDLQTLGY